MTETQVAELALGAETTPVLVHREVDVCAPALDERGVPLLVVQQAAQAEPARGASRGLRVTWEGRKQQSHDSGLKGLVSPNNRWLLPCTPAKR